MSTDTVGLWDAPPLPVPERMLSTPLTRVFGPNADGGPSGHSVLEEPSVKSGPIAT